MSPERVVDEIDYIVKTYQKNRFAFNDNSYEDPGNNIERQLKIANRLIEKDLKIGYSINYRTGFYAHATETFMEKMLSSGLISVFIGIESGNQDDIDLYNKHTTIEECKKAIMFFSQYQRLAVMIGFINLNPYTTKDRLMQNAKFLFDIGYSNNISTYGSKLTPYKGTRLYDIILQDELLKDNGNYTYSFKYKNNEINHIDNYISSIFKEYSKLKQANYLCNVFPSTIAYVRLLSRYHHDQVAERIVEKFYISYMEILQELNYQVFTWFETVLDEENLLQNAEILNKRYIEQSNLYNNYIQLEKMKTQLLLSLSKHDKAYIRCF